MLLDACHIMFDTTSTLNTINELILDKVSTDGVMFTKQENLLLIRESNTQSAEHRIYDPMLIFATQGAKRIHLNDQLFEYSAGSYLAVFMPMAFKCDITVATPESPLLAVGVGLDRHRLAQMLAKMDDVETPPSQLGSDDLSGVFTAAISEQMLDAISRLMHTLDNPMEQAILGDSLIQEIYYRVLTQERQGALRVLLRQHGQMQQMARAVDYLQENLDKNITVDELAAQVNMSGSGFHKKFKQIMHVSPLQYVKSIRLNKARSYILEGAKASDACYRVGYNSAAQFSREYKRQFGVSPSDTRTSTDDSPAILADITEQ